MIADTPSPWLSPAELAELTGYQRAAEQRDWLTRNGFTERVDYFLTAAAKPRLLRAALERRNPTAGAERPAVFTPYRPVGPNLRAIR